MYKIHEDLISVDKAYMKMFEECSDRYVAMVCNAKYTLIDSAVIMERLIRAEIEIKELKELLLIKLSNQSNDELVTD